MFTAQPSIFSARGRNEQIIEIYGRLGRVADVAWPFLRCGNGDLHHHDAGANIGDRHLAARIDKAHRVLDVHFRLRGRIVDELNTRRPYLDV